MKASGTGSERARRTSGCWIVWMYQIENADEEAGLAPLNMSLVEPKPHLVTVRIGGRVKSRMADGR